MGDESRAFDRPTSTDRPPDIVTVVDTAGRRQYASPSMETQLGYSPEAVRGESAFEHVYPEDRPRLLEIFDEGVETGRRSAGAVFRYRDDWGNWRWLESVGVNLLEDPRFESVVIDTRVVPDRVAGPPQGTAADVEPETGPMGVLVLDDRSEVLATTPAAAALTGCSEAELIGTRIAPHLPGEWAAPTDGGPLALVAGRPDDRPRPDDGVLEFVRRDGGGGPIEVSIVAVPPGPIDESLTVVGIRPAD